MLFFGLRGHRVIVNLSTGEAVRGVVVSAGLFTVRISGPAIIEPGRPTPVDVDGIVRIPSRTVTWIQEL